MWAIRHLRPALARFVLVLAVGLAGCDGETEGVDAAPADATVPDAADVDAGCDAAVDAALDADTPDASPDSAPDASPDAAPPDAGYDCSTCVATSPCTTPVCTPRTGCGEEPLIDGSDCSTAGAESICVTGMCVARGCGDGYREPGPTPAREGCDDGNTVDGDACTSTCAAASFVVASTPGGSELPPAGRTVAVDDDGRALVLYVAKLGARSYVLRGQRYTAAGLPVGGALTLAGPAFDAASFDPSAVGQADGWVVAWVDLGLDRDGTAIGLRGVAADGTLGPAVTGNASVATDQRAPELARQGAAGVVLTWTDGLGPSAYTRVLARRFDPQLAPAGGEVVVGGGDLADHLEPGIAASPSGFAVAWTRRVLGEDARVFVRRYTASGTALDATGVLVSQLTDGSASDGAEATLTALTDGSYLVAWTTLHDDLRGDVLGRAVPATGALEAQSFPIAAEAGLVERHARMVASGAGLVALVSSDTSSNGLLRDLLVSYIGVGAPPELPGLAAALRSSARQVGGALAIAPGAIWVVWGEDPSVTLQAPATLAFLLPPPGTSSLATLAWLLSVAEAP